MIFCGVHAYSCFKPVTDWNGAYLYVARICVCIVVLVVENFSPVEGEVGKAGDVISTRRSSTCWMHRNFVEHGK